MIGRLRTRISVIVRKNKNISNGHIVIILPTQGLFGCLRTVIKGDSRGRAWRGQTGLSWTSGPPSGGQTPGGDLVMMRMMTMMMVVTNTILEQGH